MRLPEGTKEERLNSFIKQLGEQIALTKELIGTYEIPAGIEPEAFLKKEITDYQVILNLLKQI